jgi:2-oxoglutarate ferredoxin oxidoreductase subunit alpha
MTEPFAYPEDEMDRGKVLNAEQLRDVENWGRYKDVDGDGIGYRTLPGNTNPMGAYFARGTGHNEYAVYSERADDWENNLIRLARKHDTARTIVPKPVLDERDGATVGIIAYGSADPAIEEARDRLRAQGLETSYLRLRALPLGQETTDFVNKYDRVYLVEMNFDGQMCSLVRLHVPEHAAKVRSIAHCDGLPLTARFVTEAILEKEH